ncbi:hypothetical protein [Candidatus Methylomicrobium oryzae]|jgi:hypothetical protein|uniref:hypothetical protein n=1 Tax=Candidatus Methylomicrobium oryzae TaxID=2802053 RepID=UPI0019248973|nr:hypothetical protein [Methylomicrobium sp. RS1]MBL1264486.1 hypothetical protein [Methylomicrobium sp. RS1]
MKSFNLLGLIAVSFCYIPAIQAAEHHSGHGAGMSGGGGGSASQCQKARLERFNPPHLAKVAPGAAFSFYAFNIDNPSQLSATVKKEPVELTAEYKEPYFLVKGKLPAHLTKTAARIDIKASAKSPHCEEEKGWLLIIE